MQSVEEFKKQLISAYEFEVKMCNNFINKFIAEGDTISANIFLHRKNTFEELILSLTIPGFYDKEWTDVMETV